MVSSSDSWCRRVIRGVVGAVRCVRCVRGWASGASGASAVAAGVDTVVIIIIVIIITLATLGGRDSRPLFTHSLTRSFAPCLIKTGFDRLQPQPGHVSRVLREGNHD